MILLASTAIGEEPSLDLRLAVEIYDAQQSQVDRLVEAGDAKDRVLAIRSCFEALRRGDTNTALDQLGAARHSNAEAPPILFDLESVAGAVIALYLADDNKARDLLARLPEKTATKPHGLLPPLGNLREETQGDPPAEANAAAVSYNNHLRARLLYLAGDLNAAYTLVHQVALERQDRLGTSHPDTWDASIDLVEYGLPIVGGETLYDFSTTLNRQSASGAPPSARDSHRRYSCRGPASHGSAQASHRLV
ncbi:hypothetical protein [Posidoniimonas corsicana]|nr:hypothetical protein [Posidoniimonas corsicana]